MRSSAFIFLFAGLIAGWLMSGCAQTWIIEDQEEGGIIGFRGEVSESTLERKLHNLISCPDSAYEVTQKVPVEREIVYEHRYPVTYQTSFYQVPPERVQGGREPATQKEPSSGFLSEKKSRTQKWLEVHYRCQK